MLLFSKFISGNSVDNICSGSKFKRLDMLSNNVFHKWYKCIKKFKIWWSFSTSSIVLSLYFNKQQCNFFWQILGGLILHYFSFKIRQIQKPTSIFFCILKILCNSEKLCNHWLRNNAFAMSRPNCIARLAVIQQILNKRAKN